MDSDGQAGVSCTATQHWDVGPRGALWMSLCSTIILNTSARLGWILNPLLHSQLCGQSLHKLHLQVCTLPYWSGPYLKQWRSPGRRQSTVGWCQANNHSLNVSNIKQLVIDFRERVENTPQSASMEPRWRWMSYKSVDVNFINLSWSNHIDTATKQAHQCLSCLKRGRKFESHLQWLLSISTGASWKAQLTIHSLVRRPLCPRTKEIAESCEHGPVHLTNQPPYLTSPH